MIFRFNDLSFLGNGLSSFGGFTSLALRLVVLGAAATYPQSCQLDFGQLQQTPQPTASDTAQASGELTERSASAESCPALLEGPPRGLSCLQCMQPEAQAQAQEIISLLRESCAKNLIINYLADGTFSFNEMVLHNHISQLTDGGRQLFLQFYLTNGPAQRRGASNSEAVFPSDIEPEEFRERILDDTEVQERYKQLIARLVPTLRYAQERGAQIALVPMLEDNLDEASFMKMAKLIFAALPSDISVSIGRNPCKGCGTGSDDEIPPGVFEESHSLSDASRLRDGVLTNDGKDYSIDGPRRGFLSLGELLSARDTAEKHRNAFILWSAERQGFSVDEAGRLVRRPPSERNYAMPDEHERSLILQFLREGLTAPAFNNGNAGTQAADTPG
jgi:hypothetical protein